MKKKGSTLTLRLDKNENDILDRLKASIGEKTGTTALMKAAVLCMEQQKVIKDLKQALYISQREMDEAMHKLNAAKVHFNGLQKSLR